MPISRNQIITFYALGAFFVVLSTLGIVYEFPYVNILPVLLLFVVTGLLWLDKLFLMMVFFVPLSLTIREITEKMTKLDISMPAEPLLISILFIFLLKLLQGYRLDKKIAYHPISIAIYIYLSWIFITACFSTLPGISFKFLLARLWFIIPSYFVATQVFRDKKNIFHFIWLYTATLIVVMIYTIKHHSFFYFDEESANWVVKPFYNDHTAYAAMMVMFIVPLFGFLGLKKYSKTLKVFCLVLIVFFILATILSYTRAAWVSLAAALALLILMTFKVRFNTLVMIFVAGLLGFFLFQQRIVMNLEENNQQSSDDMAEHVGSITNISSDASNKERINRWNCAIRMFNDKPIMGFGPGTYTFKYGPYQANKDKTIISTNEGDGGNAHSEYLGPLSEQGIPGLFTFLIVAYFVFSTGFRLCYTLKNRELKILTYVIVLSLTTYYVHGFLNNFLDTDKAAVPFWGFIAALAAIDVYHKESDLVSIN